MTKLIISFFVLVLTIVGLLALQGCGSDANAVGIGAECTTNAACSTDLTCLTEFKGGYCGKSACVLNADCPSGSICVMESGVNYCFMTCTQKDECNAHRTLDNEANCSADVVKTETGDDKVCVPPSGE